MLRIITDKRLRMVIWVCMGVSIASASKSCLFIPCHAPCGTSQLKSSTIYQEDRWISMSLIRNATVLGFISVVALCQPLAFYWDTTIEGGWCASSGIVTAMSYLVSACAIVTDWTCSLVPCFVVWQLQMKARVKASVCGVLALGIIASAATVSTTLSIWATLPCLELGH